MSQEGCPRPAARSSLCASALFVRHGTSPALSTATLLASLAMVACNDMLGLTAPSLEVPDSLPADSAPGTWQSDMPTLSAGRALHTASLLPNGDVALFGGCESPTGSPIDVLSRVSPARWERLDVESDAACPFGQAVALDAQGRAVVAGGFRQGTPQASTVAMEYSLSTASVSLGALAPSAGYWTATPLGDGRALLAGGSSELLSTLGTSLASVRGSFGADGAYARFLGAADVVCGPGDTSCMLPRTFHAATLLGDGSVLLSGGRNGDEIVPTAERYLPSERRFVPAGDMPSPRWLHAATLLADGRVFLCGGNDTTGATTSAQVFDPDEDPPFHEVTPMRVRRAGHTATLLRDGRVLVVGGSDDRRAELYDPQSETWSFTPEMAAARHLHTATLLPDGEVLVAGGQESAAPIPFGARATVERYVP